MVLSRWEVCVRFALKGGTRFLMRRYAISADSREVAAGKMVRYLAATAASRAPRGEVDASVMLVERAA